MDYAIRTNLLTKQYNGIAIVDNVNLAVPQGSIYGLIGRNGAGKSTLINMLAGITMPSSGKLILLNKKDKKGLRSSRKKMGFSLASASFYNALNVAENLEYYRMLKGYPRKSIVADLIKLVGLEENSSKPYRLLSLGMKQKLSLALALMGDPEIVVLDEPTNGLDPQSMSQFKEIILSINKDKGTTFVIATHMLNELSTIATHYGFMADGKLLEQISDSTLSEICRTRTELSVDDTSKAIVTLEKELHIKEYEILGNNIINIYDYYGSNSFIVNALVNDGVGIESIVSKTTSLNDYFLNIVHGDKK